MSVDESVLREVVRRVLSVAAPNKIILFGSAATGQMTKDSDLDLLVVEPQPNNTRERSVQISRAIGNIAYPVDVIVMRTERFEGTKQVIGGIAYPANKYGRVIYENLQEEIDGLLEQWIAKANADLEMAERIARTLPLGSDIREGIGFHCQQAAEKYLKAVLTRHQIEFPKTHKIAELLELMSPVDAEAANSMLEADWLTPFGVDLRYPGDRPEMLAGDEVRAIESARRVKRIVFRMLSRGE